MDNGTPTNPPQDNSVPTPQTQPVVPPQEPEASVLQQPVVTPTDSAMTPSVTPPAPILPEPTVPTAAPAPSTPDSSPVVSDPTPAVQPVTQASFSQEIVSSPTTVFASLKQRWPLLLAVLAIIIFGVLALTVFTHKAKPAATHTSMTSASVLTVPKDATIIEQCADGLGTQYVMPKDIPNGPVYNVYQGKVIGIEYMIAASELQNMSDKFTNLSLMSKTYDHVDVMLMDGHAGFPEQHFEVDVMMVPKSVTEKIKCSGTDSKQHMNSGTSTTPSTTSDMSKSGM